ncbi:hypothetical protein [Roseicyclus amphidinii]|uniref:hypothetical protein n=1 Tax=Roseicyclus amphidinii TaxID=3034232 RepID=UPI0024E17062|nr:hypothetical protein [Roseicyclus sp. Amp-Y-6]
MLTRLRRFWAMLNTPSDFQGEPYGAVTNQISHSAVAAWLFLFLSCSYFVVVGEMPPRWGVGWMVVVGYALLIEWRVQGWRGRDSWADVAFWAALVVLIAASTEEVRADGFHSHIIVNIAVLWSGLVGVGMAWLAYALARMPQSNTGGRDRS